ncbi:response regulator [Aporhodopirellula aestuarii]|uniref:Response regulator n=1 Tax=Aporhodopirellula aestuarii TaxID=2950107 RepID=A0ABT0U1G7_9BACT|nr:response regulator [Aporhodopirellula aestuarii]MCM2370626.1 response regulator [Aporhodopirellula aestuarii]
MWSFKKEKPIDEMQASIPREQLIRNSRTVIIDDEEPDLKQDLEQRGFAVTWSPDMDQNLQRQIEAGLYDLVLLDFGGVGKEMGHEEGLAILRHIKRVCPGVSVLSYTSKSLDATQADFYRLTDGVLSKDTGIAESLEKVEDALRQANSAGSLWKSLLARMDIKPGTEQEVELQKKLWASARNPGKRERFNKYLNSVLDDENTQKAAGVIAGKLLVILASA